MNKIIRDKKRFLSLLFAGLYFFAVVFSGFFHTHTTHFKEEVTTFKNASNSSKIVNFGGMDDCFSSHFFNAGTAILNSENHFLFSGFSFSVPVKIDFNFIFSSQKNHLFSLRAPPFV